jgi:hypothetical protein
MAESVLAHDFMPSLILSITLQPWQLLMLDTFSCKGATYMVLSQSMTIPVVHAPVIHGDASCEPLVLGEY